MKKFFALTMTLALALTTLAGCGGTASSTASKGASSASKAASAVSSGSAASSQATALKSTELNLYTWEGMFPQAVLDGFTKETGIKINYSSFDTDETMLAKLETAKGGDYDVVIADDYILQTAISEGLATKLDQSQLKNLGNVDPFYQHQFFDPESAYTVPYGAGVQTIVYDPATVKKPITGYTDLWDASLKSSIGITANPRVMNGMALKIAGKSYNTEDLADIDAAGAKMLELAPNIRLIKDDNLQDDLVSGEISVGVMYTSQATAALLADSTLKMVYPSEGIGFGVMAQFIPSKAPHADAAYAFIDYILRAEVAKQCFEELGYYCTNSAAYGLLDASVKDYIILPDEMKKGTEMIQNISAQAVEEHTKVWTKFRTATGQ